MTQQGASVAAPRAGLIECVSFNESDADRASRAAHDCRVKSRRQAGHDGRLKVIRGRYRRRLDLGLLSLSPVVVRRDRIAVAVEQLEQRIL